MRNKSNLLINLDEVSLYNLIIIFWKERLLILCCIFLFSILGVAYAIFRPMELKTIIVLNDPSVVIFQKYNKYFLNENNIDFNTNTKTNTNTNNNTNTNTSASTARDIFLGIFFKNFLSIDNLNEFIKISSEQNINLKSNLKNNELVNSSFFYGNKFGRVNLDKRLSYPTDQVFFLIYPEEIDGVKALNDYVFYIKKKSEIDFHKIVQSAIISQIDIKKEAFDITAKTKLQYLNDIKLLAASSLNNELINNINKSLITNYVNLEQEIINFEKDLISIKEINLNYVPISQKPTPPIRDTKFPNYFIIISSILLGLFISIVILVFRLKKT